ncbi:MAG TPA: hypothetical protein VFL62_08960 [Bradyrhizobium sp.]|nr:hypothetical protein [Bradyrhizobium sp.]
MSHLIMARAILACIAAFDFTAGAHASSHSGAPDLAMIGEIVRPDAKSNDLATPVLASVRWLSPDAASETSASRENRIRLAADLPVKAPPPSLPSCPGGLYYLPGTDMCTSLPVKAGYNFKFECFGDTGIGYTISAYTGGLSIGGNIGQQIATAYGDFKPSYSGGSGWTIGAGFETGLHAYNWDVPKDGHDYNWDVPKWTVGGGLGGWDHLGGYGSYDKPVGGDTIRIGVNYRFDDPPRRSEPTKTPPPVTKIPPYAVIDYNGLKLGGYVKADDNPVGTFPGEGSSNWGRIDYRAGLNMWGGAQVFVGTRQSTDGYSNDVGRGGKIYQPRWEEWDVIRDPHFGDTYDISYQYDDGTEDRFSAFYDLDGNYHERWDYYDHEAPGNDEQTDYVYDGTSMTLISRTHTDWEWDAVYVHQTISTNGKIVDLRNSYSYFDLAIGQGVQSVATTLLQVQLAQLFLNVLSLPPSFMAPDAMRGGARVAPPAAIPLASDSGLPVDVVPIVGDGGSVDVVPIVGDLGGDVDLDMGGAPGGPASAPDANVKMQAEQAGPAPSPSSTGNPKRGDIETLRPIPVSLTSLEFAENATARDKAKTANPAPAPAPAEKPAVALKLFTNKPALPTASGPRPLDVGFDHGPAACLTDKTGSCSVTVPSSERRFYGLIGSASDFAVKLKVPYTTAIVWREKDGAAPATIDAIRQRMPSLPPEVRAKARSFTIGDKRFSQAMIEASDFNPSPDRWKNYLRPTTPAPTPPATKMKRGDAAGNPMDSYAQGGDLGSAQSDDCHYKQPAAYVEGQPLAVSDVAARELKGATLHIEAVR